VCMRHVEPVRLFRDTDHYLPKDVALQEIKVSVVRLLKVKYPVDGRLQLMNGNRPDHCLEISTVAYKKCAEC